LPVRVLFSFLFLRPHLLLCVPSLLTTFHTSASIRFAKAWCTLCITCLVCFPTPRRSRCTGISVPGCWDLQGNMDSKYGELPRAAVQLIRCASNE
jgi:hypothetical protein